MILGDPMKGSAILDGLKNIALISAQDSFKQSLNTEKEMVSVDHVRAELATVRNWEGGYTGICEVRQELFYGFTAIKGMVGTPTYSVFHLP